VQMTATKKKKDIQYFVLGCLQQWAHAIKKYCWICKVLPC